MGANQSKFANFNQLTPEADLSPSKPEIAVGEDIKYCPFTSLCIVPSRHESEFPAPGEALELIFLVREYNEQDIITTESDSD